MKLRGCLGWLLAASCAAATAQVPALIDVHMHF